MRLEDVLPAYRAGKAIRREAWEEGSGYANGDRGRGMVLYRGDVDATDWLVIDDPITITREQLKRVWGNMDYDGQGWDANDLWRELSK